MYKKTLHIPTLFVLFLITVILACSKKEESSPKLTMASGLTYTPAILELKTGTAGSSVKPNITAEGALTYSLTTSPASNGAISIDSDGIIKVGNTLAAGEYSITVTVANSAGSISFPNAYKVKITANPTIPSGLTYSTNTLTMEAGETRSSVVPSISGSQPLSFFASSTPSSSAITIDNTGKLNFGSALTTGTYKVTVTATNAAGTATFDNIFTVTVNAVAPGPKNLTYTPNTITITAGSTVTSATPTIVTNGSVTYSASTSPSSSAITINNQGIISANNSLPAGTYKVSVTATNAEGSKTFSDIYTIVVNPAVTLTTYNNTVQAIIQNNCGSCHTGGGNTRYDIYANAKNNIDMILTRINLPQGAAGMMPNGGTKLSQSLINQIQKWKDDGLKEQ